MRRNRPGLGAAEIATLVASAVLACVIFLDGPAVGWARGLDPALVGLFRTLTDLGKSDWLLIPMALGLLWLASRPLEPLGTRARAALETWAGILAYALVVVGGSGLIVTIAKRVIGRARPKHLETHGVFDFTPFASDAGFASFPSGHAATVFAFAAVVALLVPRLRWPAFACAFWLALSRVAVGAHYPSDALAGGVFALWFALMARGFFAERGWVFVRDAAGIYRVKTPGLMARGLARGPAQQPAAHQPIGYAGPAE